MAGGAAAAGGGSFAGAAGALGGLGGLIGTNPTGASQGFISPLQRPFLEDLFNRAQDVTGQGNFVGFDPLQVAGQENALSAARGLSPLISGAQSANQFLLGDVLNPASNPFLAASARAATQPIFEGLTQNILPAIRGEAALTGNVGSSRQGIAEGLAAQGAQRTAGDISTNIFSGGFGQGLNALIQGLQLAPQSAQFGLLPSQIQQQVGGQRRELRQEEALNPFLQAQRFQGLLGGPIIESRTEPGGGSGLSGLFGSTGLFGSGGLGGKLEDTAKDVFTLGGLLG